MTSQPVSDEKLRTEPNSAVGVGLSHNTSRPPAAASAARSSTVGTTAGTKTEVIGTNGVPRGGEEEEEEAEDVYTRFDQMMHQDI